MKEIHWMCTTTGIGGHGSPLEDSVAERTCEFNNKQYSTIYHWTVKVI